MKSNINSEQVKRLVYEAVEKALNECAVQHEAYGEPYEGYDSVNLTEQGHPTPMGLVDRSEGMLKFANIPPEKLKLTFNFYWSKEGALAGQPSEMFCQPVIDLAGIEDDKSSE